MVLCQQILQHELNISSKVTVTLLASTQIHLNKFLNLRNVNKNVQGIKTHNSLYYCQFIYV